jgi:hypothetical protein
LASITGGTAAAHPELIEAEALAAERWVAPPSAWDGQSAWLA